ncbi:MAG: hypothetical protein JKY98_08125 [Gammaproteobacteria bacterium]|nr:hypothetical protein [Gammaproteobacteria bacterium]
MKIVTRLLILSYIVTALGCSTTATYDPELEGELLKIPLSLLNGKALILTTAGDDQYEYPVYGNLQLGEITREIAVNVFSRIFKEGAEHSNSQWNAEEYAIIVTPRPVAYNFDLKYRRYLGYAESHQVEISILVRVTTNNDEVIHLNTYSSGIKESEIYPAKGLEIFTRLEKINGTTHEAITELLNRAATDVYNTLKN